MADLKEMFDDLMDFTPDTKGGQTMTDIGEIFDDFADNSKKLFKSKKFLIIAGGVGVVALFVAWRKNSTAETTTDGSAAIGYAGYPTVGGAAAESYDSIYDSGIVDEFNSILSENESYYQGLIGNMQTEYENTFDSLQTNIIDLSDRLQDSTSLIEQQQYELERQNAISQMKANSELYNNISDRATKDALHAENAAIAEKYGFTFDGNSGNWFDGESVVYTTSVQQSAALTGKTAAPATTAYQNNRNYQQEINDAIMNGADATTINELNAARNAKIAASGGTTNANTSYDMNTDYATLISKAKETGASAEVISNLEAQRAAKIAANPELAKYK